MVTNIILSLGTVISIYSGIKFGYFDSHTPPPPFIISSLLVIIGLLLIFLKKITAKKAIYTFHLIIIGVNLIIILFCFLPLFM